MNWDLLNRRFSYNGNTDISLSTIITLLIFAAVIFAFFFILKKYVLPFLNSRRAVKKAKVNTFRIEVLVWTLYGIFAIYHLLADSLWITVILITITGLAGLNFWRDVFAGIIFRLDSAFNEGDPVRYGEYIGTLEKLGKRYIVLKTDHEELVNIPYRKLGNGLLVKRQAKGKLLSARLIFDIGEDDQESMIEKIRQQIYNCPWAILNDRPLIQKTDGNQLSVTVYAVDKTSLDRVEKYLHDQLLKP